MSFWHGLKGRWAGVLSGIAAVGVAWGTATPAQALIITPTWDSSITSDANAATIEATIMGAIAQYEATYSDPITVNIKFQEGGGLGGSSTWYYFSDYATVHAAMVADGTSTDDAVALGTLPGGAANPANGSSTMIATKANLEALGISVGPTPDGFNGTITLNTSIMNLDRTGPQNPGFYDLQGVAQHEIDEILATASGAGWIGATPIDLFRYTSSGAHTWTTSGDDAYFSIDGTTMLVRYNQDGIGDYGDFHTGIGLYVQNAYGTPGAQPNLGVELRMLDVAGFTYATQEPPAVPEPSTILMTGIGLVSMAFARRRKNQASA